MISKFEFCRDFHLDAALSEPTETARKEALYKYFVELSHVDEDALEIAENRAWELEGEVSSLEDDISDLNDKIEELIEENEDLRIELRDSQTRYEEECLLNDKLSAGEL